MGLDKAFHKGDMAEGGGRDKRLGLSNSAPRCKIFRDAILKKLARCRQSVPKMKLMRNVYWSIVLFGISVYAVYLLIMMLSEYRPPPHPVLFFSSLLGLVIVLLGALVLSRLSWVHESPAVLSDLDCAAVRRRSVMVRIVMPLLAGIVMSAATWLLLLWFVVFIVGLDVHDTGFGVSVALTVIGALTMGSLLWSAGIGWGEDDYWRSDH